MKPIFPILGLSALLSACGTGLIPPVTQNLPDINVTLPPASSVSPVVVYLRENQFGNQPDIVNIVNSVEISGELVYTVTSPLSDLSNVGIYIRPNIDGANCYNQAGYLICSGDSENSYKLQDLDISKGLKVNVTLAGKLLDTSVKTKTGYIGFRINQGNTTQGDTISITKVKAVVRF